MSSGRRSKDDSDSDTLLALYHLATNLNSDEMKQKHGDNWLAVGSMLASRIAHYQGKRSHGMGRRTDVYERLPEGVGAARAKFGLASGMGTIDWFEGVGRLLQSINPNIEMINAAMAGMQEELGPQAASEHRPALSSKLSRFDPSFDPKPSPRDVGSIDIREARCTIQHTGRIVNGAIMHSCGTGKCGVIGGTGWKYREPYVSFGTVTGGGDVDKIDCKPVHVTEVKCGFWGRANSVFMDDRHDLLWSSGDERIKAYSVVDKNANILCISLMAES